MSLHVHGVAGSVGMNFYYAGIGSRETPPYVQDWMKATAAWIATNEGVLRSGAADGADTAFEQGCDAYSGKKQIFLPWPGFNGRVTTARFECETFGVFDYVSQMAYEEAAKHHPAWDRLTRGPRALHARNVQQILGADLLSPVAFVVCWTPGGSGSGGTGQALRIARARGIPVLDVGRLSGPSPGAWIEAHVASARSAA